MTAPETVTAIDPPGTPARDDESRLPPRVMEGIRRQQASSEVLIGWVQLAVVLIFATLYTIAPKTFTAEADFAPVPWALAFYFTFTLIRLVLAHRGSLPDWMLYLSVSSTWPC